MFFLNFRENFSRLSSSNNRYYDTVFKFFEHLSHSNSIIAFIIRMLLASTTLLNGKRPRTESYYNECKAINDSALRVEMINR